MVNPKDVFEPYAALLALVDAWEVGLDAYLVTGNNLKKSCPGQSRSITIYRDNILRFIKENAAVREKMQERCPSSDLETPFKQGDQKLMQVLAERYSPAWRFDIRYEGQNNLSYICLTEK